MSILSGFFSLPHSKDKSQDDPVTVMEYSYAKGALIMTLVSLTDGCRLLAVDPKTLRRWMSLFQVSAQPHPNDARVRWELRTDPTISHDPSPYSS